jgi:hypothetical protein
MRYAYREKNIERERKVRAYLCEKKRVDFLMNENRPNPFYQIIRVTLENGSFLHVPNILANEKACRNYLQHSVHQTYDMLYDVGYTLDKNAEMTIADETITLTYAIAIDDPSYDGIVSINELNKTMAKTIAQNLLNK